MPKYPSIQGLIDSMALKINPESPGFEASQAGNICMTCPNQADTFKDALSLKEFGISGMCQQCQDRVFGV